MATSACVTVLLAASLLWIARNVECLELPKCRDTKLGCGRYPFPCHHHNNQGHHHCGGHDGTFTCGARTAEKLSYFVNPRNTPVDCKFTVVTREPRVTQLRLDFEKFSLAQPELVDWDPSKNKYPAYSCAKDSFSVSSPSIGQGKLGFESLCGENTGQHIYIPVNSALGSTTELRFHLAERSGDNAGLIHPNWRIKVTQLECMAPMAKDKCAPAGCLQYYPGRSGTFESFNYNNGAGHYQGNLNYAICFKRYNGICSIVYTPIKFQLAANNMETPYGPNGCDLATSNPAEPNSQDYLFIPEGHTETGVNASLFCGNALQNNPVKTNAPGPMFVNFRTDGVSDETALGDEIGFRIRYDESEAGC